MFEKRSDMRAKLAANWEAAQRQREHERIGHHLGQALERYGVRDEVSGVVTLAFTPEVMAFLNDPSDVPDFDPSVWHFWKYVLTGRF